MCVRAPAQPRIDRAEPVADMFWGDRFGRVTDPFGVRWGDRHSHGGRVSRGDQPSRGRGLQADLTQPVRERPCAPVATEGPSLDGHASTNR
jgi:hypothetical protein